MAGPLPPIGIRVIYDMDEVSSAKSQLTILLGVKVKQCLDVRWLLQEKQRKGISELPAAL